MRQSTYEIHHYNDTDFPIFYHLDKLYKGNSYVSAHWHEHIELLRINEGKCLVNGNGVTAELHPSDVVMFSSNCIHTITALTEECSYFCITVDRGLCDRFGVPASQVQFAFVVSNDVINSFYDSVIVLMEEKPIYYKEETKAIIMRMVIRCYRAYEENKDSFPDAANKNVMVRKAIEYLRVHFAEPTTIEELCRYVGFSKYYFCRRFKEVTGKTVVEYVNFLRCSNAKRLIVSGQYNVGESAEMSGFQNMSYFSRTYKKQMGISPSSEKVESLSVSH